MMRQKLRLLKSILEKKEHKSIIIFASTKDKVKELDREFKRSNLSIKAFHSDLEQPEREAIMLDFRNNKVEVLIGTRYPFPQVLMWTG
jgi:ATP-dependent RNA helicase RhlE